MCGRGTRRPFIIIIVRNSGAHMDSNDRTGVQTSYSGVFTPWLFFEKAMLRGFRSALQEHITQRAHCESRSDTVCGHTRDVR